MVNLRTANIIKRASCQDKLLFLVSLVKQRFGNIFLYGPVQNSNNKRSVTSDGRTVHFSTQAQDMLHTLCIPAGHRVVEEALSACKL